MARIAGIDLPKNKRIRVALTHIFGIGFSSSEKILSSTGVDPKKHVSELTDEEITRIRQEIENNYKVEGMLRTEIAMNIKRLIDINCYRGIRHKRGLPVRGQRTQTNARTRKGPGKTIGTKRKK
ncbi:MAG: 30S ribosomal protein S13 [candidate division Zixibacteria bacterium 4484_93]|nr:MAG: 30S ribosomal protein S13 [candidate division Zixibacteria bacterium 4484_93]